MDEDAELPDDFDIYKENAKKVGYSGSTFRPCPIA